MNKIETSKKFVIFTGILFALAVLVCSGIFIFCTINDREYDWTGIVSLIAVPGSVFGTAMASYFNKARYENVLKIRKSFLNEKYQTLKNIGVLNEERAINDIEEEILKIENHINDEEEYSNQDITYN